MSKLELFPCSTCLGRGEILAHIYFRNAIDRGWGFIACPRCQGAGQLNSEQRIAEVQGREARLYRIDQEISVQQQADSLGISLMDLSRLEMGRKMYEKGKLRWVEGHVDKLIPKSENA